MSYLYSLISGLIRHLFTKATKTIETICWGQLIRLDGMAQKNKGRHSNLAAPLFDKSSLLFVTLTAFDGSEYAAKSFVSKVIISIFPFPCGRKDSFGFQNPQMVRGG